ncbi:MAG TPA: DinB family protein [Thermoanaerobaculia bacterium]|nr:DinB family protein [Thermoanaerobaculia bacterium]
MTQPPPERTEAAPYYFKYIDRVGGDVVEVLDRQRTEVPELLRAISEQRSASRYAADKWSMRQVLAHINDAERVFASRAFWFARGFESPLPSFEQDVATLHARADDRSWASHIEEFESIRAATLTFFRDLPEEAWSRQGIASDNPFTVRALAYIIAGHAIHHLGVLQERYSATAAR